MDGINQAKIREEEMKKQEVLKKNKELVKQIQVVGNKVGILKKRSTKVAGSGGIGNVVVGKAMNDGLEFDEDMDKLLASIVINGEEGVIIEDLKEGVQSNQPAEVPSNQVEVHPSQTVPEKEDKSIQVVTEKEDEDKSSQVVEEQPRVEREVDQTKENTGDLSEQVRRDLSDQGMGDLSKQGRVDLPEQGKEDLPVNGIEDQPTPGAVDLATQGNENQSSQTKEEQPNLQVEKQKCKEIEANGKVNNHKEDVEMDKEIDNMAGNEDGDVDKEIDNMADNATRNLCTREERFAATVFNNRITFMAVSDQVYKFNTEEDGVKPCGLYPYCTKILGEGEKVGQVKIISPVEHFSYETECLICWDQAKASIDGIESLGGDDNGPGDASTGKGRGRKRRGRKQKTTPKK